MRGRRRVLVVAEPSPARQALVAAWATHPALRVVGTARPGAEAVAQAVELRPDAAVVELAGADPAAALRALRTACPGLPLVVHADREDQIPNPLAAPATAVLRPKAGPELAGLLADRILGLSPAPHPAAPRATSEPVAAAGAPRRRVRRVSGLVLAASTGGPDAVSRLLSLLPRPFPLPVAIVQHMPPVFTTMFAQRLATASGLDVLEARDGTPLLPGRVVVAPGDHHLRLVSRSGAVVAALDRGPLENSCRPAADVLFRSAAEAWRGEVLAVVLTGLGRDGVEGCRAVAEAGGRVLVQDRATSVAFGMPGSVADAGLADQVLSLDQLSAAVAAHALGREVAPC